MTYRLMVQKICRILLENGKPMKSVSCDYWYWANAKWIVPHDECLISRGTDLFLVEIAP